MPAFHESARAEHPPTDAAPTAGARLAATAAPLPETPSDVAAETAWGEFSADEGSATSISALRGKHRVIKQRNALARSSTVLGVGVIAAVGAGGIAAAQGKAPVSISMPDAIAEHIPQSVASLPVVSSLLPDEKPAPAAVLAGAPLTTAGVTTADFERGDTDAGEALRARILQQASAQQQAADDAQRAAAEQDAVRSARAEAAKTQAAAEKKADEAKQKAAAEAKKKAEAARLAELAKSYTLPVVSYTITGQFGDPGPLWSSGYHTGLDFAAPTGTPIKAVHSGTVTSAGWAGSYGYRTVVKLDDGEELWYCHQSSMLVSVGQKVSTGDVIGRVGATGNVTGPHLHLEVRTTAGTAIDPRPWLEDHGLKP
ncbi:M23 family metallopeptidase [Streptomyces sp. NBC_01497]|uniref:M23 family metallopeptidase n=1 Tax=Streptomyces sp. NBC_01497 TaxID=2903885 RepID=UPI002E37083C|nr:M23 family metallopeptidase [Streptomyces sp. NBC_01497]